MVTVQGHNRYGWAEVVEDGEVLAAFLGDMAMDLATIYAAHFVHQSDAPRYPISFMCAYCGVGNDGADWVASAADDRGRYCAHCRNSGRLD